MKPRSVYATYQPPPVHWVGDGFRVHGYFGAHPELSEGLSPFLMMDYHPVHDYPPAKDKRRGVGTHPHRGFETVTLAFAGSVEHHDSAGNHGVIGPGDVQWMTAARGILHQEYHETEYAKKGGPFHMMQLWVNLPAKHKMDPPRYQEIVAKDIPQITQEGAVLHLIAGEVGEVKGPAQTMTPVHLSRLKIQAGKSWSMPVIPSHGLAMLLMKGEVVVQSKLVKENDLAVFAKDGDGIQLESKQDADLILLGGEPIKEPIAAYGPFVMNTKEEIIQAVNDYQRGAFGVL